MAIHRGSVGNGSYSGRCDGSTGVYPTDPGSESARDRAVIRKSDWNGCLALDVVFVDRGDMVFFHIGDDIVTGDTASPGQYQCCFRSCLSPLPEFQAGRGDPNP